MSVNVYVARPAIGTIAVQRMQTGLYNTQQAKKDGVPM